jgi:LPS-assembly lipoprotein
LGACGFEPAFAPNGPAAALFGDVSLSDPNSQNAYDFVDQMETRLGRSSNGRFVLAYDMSVSEDSLGVTTDQEITRYNVLGTIDYTLTDTTTGLVARTGQVKSFTSYSATSTLLAARTAETDAQRRLMVILADKTVTQLVAHSKAITS